MSRLRRGCCTAPRSKNNQNVCPKCTHHMRVGAPGAWSCSSIPPPKDEIGANIALLDVLKFKDTKKYKDRPERIARRHRRDRCARGRRRRAQGARRSWPAPSNSASWAAPWARWWANASCARPMFASSARSHWCASRPAAARACRRRCFRSCRWPRPAPCWRAWASAASRISPCSPTRPWVACRRASPCSAMSSSPSPKRSSASPARA